MTAKSTRTPCFFPRTPSLPRDGAPRLLTLFDMPSPHLFQALGGHFGSAWLALVPATAVESGFTHLPLPGGHHLLIHGDKTVLLLVWNGQDYHWFPVALHARMVEPHTVEAHAPRIIQEALLWIRQAHNHPVGWEKTCLLPVHRTTADPRSELPTASLGGQTVLRAPVERFHPFFGLAASFLERHPTLVWDNLHYMMGMVDVRGEWRRDPQLTLFFPKRQGASTAKRATKDWTKWSTAFFREVLKKRTMPAEHLAGWYWNTQHPDGRAYRCHYSVTLAMDYTDNPFAQGIAYDLHTGTSSHQRMALHAAFQRAAPDTYARWMGA